MCGQFHKKLSQIIERFIKSHFCHIISLTQFFSNRTVDIRTKRWKVAYNSTGSALVVYYTILINSIKRNQCKNNHNSQTNWYVIRSGNGHLKLQSSSLTRKKGPSRKLLFQSALFISCKFTLKLHNQRQFLIKTNKLRPITRMFMIVKISICHKQKRNCHCTHQRNEAGRASKKTSL